MLLLSRHLSLQTFLDPSGHAHSPGKERNPQNDCNDGRCDIEFLSCGQSVTQFFTQRKKPAPNNNRHEEAGYEKSEAAEVIATVIVQAHQLHGRQKDPARE